MDDDTTTRPSSTRPSNTGPAVRRTPDYTRLASLAIADALDSTRDIGDYLASFTAPRGRRWYHAISVQSMLGLSRSAGSAGRLPTNLDVTWAADQFIKAARRAEDLVAAIPKLAEVGFTPDAGRVGAIVGDTLAQLRDLDVAGLSTALDELSPRSDDMHTVVARVATIESVLRSAQTKVLLASTTPQSGSVDSQ